MTSFVLHVIRIFIFQLFGCKLRRAKNNCIVDSTNYRKINVRFCKLFRLGRLAKNNFFQRSKKNKKKGWKFFVLGSIGFGYKIFFMYMNNLKVH